MKINYLEIGQRIRNVRQKRGITQEKLAEIVKAGTTHISHIETGNTIPSMKMFISIINALDVSADELLCDNINKSKYIYQNEIAEIINGCTEKEIRVVVDVLKSVVASIRKNL
ncbi:Helix-turn-helix domain-containing protein [Sporobacter termitidis DSM 10068]|uniref:Helix-turn-helix domain-containing protein n=1 Tax=Sporobacter termitidis DSM 10068 TaxID=1123282 RepID=A0A1M5Y195_9FIRM|nr:helix-turn-helix transcriptional regulator [Sporobacter termitidis]SHI05841.1 Helix-turn-helix domain-containing protein [Sporobacter termitidis DSM 10068]